MRFKIKRAAWTSPVGQARPCEIAQKLGDEWFVDLNSLDDLVFLLYGEGEDLLLSFQDGLRVTVCDGCEG